MPPHLVWVTPKGVESRSPSEIPTEVGAKAEGLLWLPRPWVPPFIVLSPDFRQIIEDTPVSSRLARLTGWHSLMDRALRLAGLGAADDLYLRSNAVLETLDERGRFRSRPCQRQHLAEELLAFFENCGASADDRLGVIVQRQVRAVSAGHLSNERRVSEEYRDGVVERIDLATGAMSEARVSFRRWRRSTGPNTDSLVCGREQDVLPVLRELLALAATRKLRVHFEWLWDGGAVHVVQADHASDLKTGSSPESLLRAPFVPPADQLLTKFRHATAADEGRPKIRNHFMYSRLGIPQPPFYVLEDPAEITRLLDGEASSALLHDLAELTKRPLVLRTSALATTKTMLPRSDQLRTPEAAVDWLLGPFAREIRRLNIQTDNLCLVAHHYLPARAAAFSTGSPSGRRVYVEALWGIPEGLYYYPCDAYLIDTRAISSTDLASRDSSTFAIQQELRFKDAFVAPDSSGHFAVHRTQRPWDWKSTIGDPALLKDIARFTRLLAGHEGKPVKVMWFLDCHQDTMLPRALPWYHDFETEAWDSSSHARARNARDEDIELRDTAGLERLEARVAQGEPSQDSRRLVISLNPVEDRFIRDESIAERVGSAAKRLGAVVELRGGVLSHLYYVLRRTDAEVSVRNQPRFNQRFEQFDKLVRDKIPEVVAAAGELARVARLPPEQLAAALKIKLVEEAFEVRDSNRETLTGELADVLEVVEALRKASGISRQQLSSSRTTKRTRRGGFDEGFVLLETGFARKEPALAGDMMLPDAAPEGVLESQQLPALESARQGPLDVRRAENFVEFVHSLSIGLSYTEWTLSSPQHLNAATPPRSRPISWTIEGRREGSRLKLRLKIRVGGQQLEIPFAVVEPADEATD